MNCNKCGTPIIPGENTCRFCGTSDNFSKREAKHEIIGFDDIDYVSDNEVKETEIIDFMIGEDEVSLNDEETPVIIDDVIKDEPVVVEEPQQEQIFEARSIFEEAVKEEKVNEEETPTEVQGEVIDGEKIVNSVIDEPPTARIPVEEVVKELDEQDEEVKMEPTVNLDATAKIETVEENKKEKPVKEPKKVDLRVFIIILSILLIASFIVNYFLYTGKSEIVKPKKVVTVNNSTLSTVVYGGYYANIPSTWTTNTLDSNHLLLLDDTKKWEVSLSLTDELDYSKLSENTSKISDALGLENYLFTSDYNKTTNNHEFYIFKGKYYEYAVYTIVTEIDSDTVALVDLKFIGEVDENILNNVLDMLSNMKKYDNTLIKENFEFKNILPSFKKVIAKES